MIFIGNLWRISCFNDAVFISVLDLIHQHITVFSRVYMKFGFFIYQRIPETAESHFKKLEETRGKNFKSDLIDELLKKRKFNPTEINKISLHFQLVFSKY
jgi:hypothetical protein